MSGEEEGAGWWQASDGKWYPPESHPDHVSTDAGPSEPIGPLASTLIASGAAKPEPPSDPRMAAAGVSFDEDGWIKIDRPPPVVAPEPAPQPFWRQQLGIGLAIAAAVVVVLAAAIVFIPRGSPSPDQAAAATIPTTATTEPIAPDPLTLDSVLTDMNVRYSDVGHGYQKVVDGAVDPLGGEGCAQPARPVANVASNHWTAYQYEPDGAGGLPLGHLAAVITVYDHTADANERMVHEKTPAYAECLTRWSRQIWFTGAPSGPVEEFMLPTQVKIPGATSVSYRYGSVYEAEGQRIPLFTDIMIFTVGRIRVWIEVSSAFEPYEEARRDLLLRRLVTRVEESLK